MCTSRTPSIIIIGIVGMVIGAFHSAWAVYPVGLEAIERFDLIHTLRNDVRTWQASSHDPTGGNNDAYQYLQVIGDEQVLMDVKGPGCVYRIWMTGFDPDKYIRIYLDDSPTPLIDVKQSVFFSGGYGPFLSPLVGGETVSSGGYYCYLPILFRQGCRITSTGARYYNITYQRYTSADGITTFTGSENSSTARSMWNNSGSDPKSDHGSSAVSDTICLPAGSTATLADLRAVGSLQQIEFNIPGLSAGTVTDNGRAFTGYCQFRVAVDAGNQGVRLKRRLDYGTGNQTGDVYVDGAYAGRWSTPGGTSNTWLDASFNVPANLSAGKSNLTIRVNFVSSDGDWNEFYYWACSLAAGRYTLTDQVDVGNSGSESSHNYTISGQTWSGSRTYPAEWKTIAQNLRLKFYWEDSPTAAVDAPLSGFFGCGLGPYRVNALPVGIDGQRMYCYFPMPFSARALLQIVNNGTMDADQISYTIRYSTLPSPLSGVGQFHAQYLAETPVTVGRDYKMLDIAGGGHFVGVVHTMRGPDTLRGYLEGDERIYVDGNKTPLLYGTGTEDFYNGAWYFSRGPFTLPVHGNAAHETGGRDATDCYRFFLSEMIPFNTAIRVGIETYITGSDYYSVAFYYQAAQPLASQTDELDVGNSASESAHGYTYTSPTWSGPSDWVYEGDDDNIYVYDDGRRLAGGAQFTVALAPDNVGVILRRRMDYSLPRQKANVYIDNILAGVWYEAGSNSTRKWRDAEFMVPAGLTSGKSGITVRIENTSSESNWTEYRYWVFSLRPLSPTGGQRPYFEVPLEVPGRIQAEYFDFGGEGEAYHDNEPANQGGQYRLAEGVDLAVCTDQGGGYYVGWIVAGEWLEYTINVPVTAFYRVRLRVASLSEGGTFHLEIDGNDVSGPRSFAATGGWQTWATVDAGVVTLAAGRHVLRLAVEAGGWNVNYLDIENGPPGKASAPNPPHQAADVSINGTVLSWTAGYNALSHDFYLGTANPPAFRRNQSGTSFSPGTLRLATTYYWRVDEVNAQGTTPGDLWTFTTRLPDFDKDGDVDLTDFGHLQACLKGNSGPPDPGCTDADLDGNGYVEQYDFALLYPCLSGAGVPITIGCGG